MHGDVRVYFHLYVNVDLQLMNSTYFFRGSEYFKILMTINFFCNLSIHLQNDLKKFKHRWFELLGQGVSSPCNLCWDINRLAWGLLLSKQILSCQKLRYILNGFIIRIWLLLTIYKSIC